MASIWRLNDQNFWVLSQNDESDQIIVHCIDLTSKRSKLLSYVPKRRKWSNYNGLHRFDIKTIQNVEIRRKTFKTTQTNESDQIIMHGIDLTSKRSKLLSYVAKLQKSSNYKSNQSTMNCIDLTSKRSKKLSYVPKLQK